ncbi:asparagine ligase A [Tepiditoga spiralis]|uniref:Asparagine ligase A n=1 Tax=Tepiditoga spiralis TaxID=2108365 RepID=A0A7G1G1E0_9BACT|nr:asparagine synthetase A [Tepiditoga spiralis]BBE29978.1 asparagine ligase A [Tepiditoga spiralis]
MKKVDSLELVKKYTDGNFFKDVTFIQSQILKSVRHVLDEKGFIEILPVIISPMTDPLNHPVFNADINYYGKTYSITKSMILHKQISTLVHEKIYSVSPNLRLETEENYDSGRHLVEFVQIDMEKLGATRDEIMDIMEEAIKYTVNTLKDSYPEIIEKYHPSLDFLNKPFKKITVKEAKSTYGEDYEKILSKKSKEPFWLIDMPLLEREFYDKQDMKNPDVLLDFDLIFPEGFGEGISGGEREHEYDQIIKRMDLKRTSSKMFEEYLSLAKEGILKPTAGCGIGVERFTRYILGLDHVENARLFAKAPGRYSI